MDLIRTLFKSFLRKWWFIVLYLLIYLLASNAVVLNRWWQYEAFYYDHVIFDSVLWQVAHFQTPYIDHLESNPISHIGDHFTPTFYLLAPLYWITSAHEPLLVMGTSLVTISAFILFLIAKTRIQNKLMVFAIVFAYTIFTGLQNTIIANFHTELLTLVALSLALLSLEKKRWGLYFYV